MLRKCDELKYKFTGLWKQFYAKSLLTLYAYFFSSVLSVGNICNKQLTTTVCVMNQKVGVIVRERSFLEAAPFRDNRGVIQNKFQTVR
jgi:hypothetical protein